MHASPCAAQVLVFGELIKDREKSNSYLASRRDRRRGCSRAAIGLGDTRTFAPARPGRSTLGSGFVDA